jgi:phosphatidylserine/phosphatidylglycerophosphate/cardiolipin synthase-like enzyme
LASAIPACQLSTGTKAGIALLREMTKSYFAEMIDAGVKVYDSPRHVHGKLWMTDDEVMVGSFNLSFPSRYSEFESGIFTDDPQLRSQVGGVFEKLFEGTEPVTEDEADSLSMKLLSFFRNLLSID